MAMRRMTNAPINAAGWLCGHVAVDKKKKKMQTVSLNADKLPEAKAFCYIAKIDEMVDGKKTEETKIALLGVWLLTGPKDEDPCSAWHQYTIAELEEMLEGLSGNCGEGR